MANRFETISAVYENTRKNIVSSPQKWADFLSSACRNYKLKFDELVLIYAQKPNTLAVLELEKWNKNFGRWVNAGAKSIAVIDDVSYGEGRLKYYFDITDTHETERSVPVPIWEMKFQYEKSVIDNLEKSFGALQNKNTLIDAVFSVSKNATKSSISDYTQVLLRNKENSFLEELDDISVSSIYEKTVQNSVAYMIASRLGIDTDMYFSREDFEEIYNFDSDEAINSVGCAVRDISEMVLFEVSKTVLSLESSNRTIDILKKAEYTDAVKEENEGVLIMTEITYSKQGDYLIPNLVLPKSENINLGRWSEIRRKYLKETQKSHYTTLLTTCNLDSHLSEIQTRAEEMEETLMKQISAQEGLTEQLKANDMMTWVQGMNNLKNRVREIILNEVIYSD